jgi:hypothetical protein
VVDEEARPLADESHQVAVLELVQNAGARAESTRWESDSVAIRSPRLASEHRERILETSGGEDAELMWK